MSLREKLLELRPNRTVKAVLLSNGVAVYVPRLSLADALKFQAAQSAGGLQALSESLKIIVRDDQGNRVFTDAEEAGNCFNADDATQLVNECLAFNDLDEGEDKGEGQSPNPSTP